ncbi:MULTISPECIES: hypothetical protein [unclassified Nitratiruptor]|uniref:hypothetical protein n=1 Tax=unclassified Nitratiruptor TaxID=2624044 RepID=UPI0019166CC6|nr:MULTISPECIES: hypothetical protein [unclassified Nitratiruptor]
MKEIFIALVLSSSLCLPLHAEYLMQYGSSEYCIDSYSIRDSDRYIDVVLSSNGKSYTLDIDQDQIHPGYEYNATSGTCNKKEVLQKLGLDYYQYNFLFALLGLLIGVSFLNAIIGVRNG